ncbi:MAG: hypothetical protein ACREJO_17300 [Phycisphaerales bacterium]
MIVPGRPDPDALNWWLLTPADLAASDIRLTLRRGTQPTNPPLPAAPRLIKLRDIPGNTTTAPAIAWLVPCTGLDPDAIYTLTAQWPGGSAHAASSTLPAQLSPTRSLTIAFGSCFSSGGTPGRRFTQALYPPPHQTPGLEGRIDLRLLVGDQIYMDLDPFTGSPIIVGSPRPWIRYLQQWRDNPVFSHFLSGHGAAAGTLVCADVHVFWNDYPHANAHLFWAERAPGGPLGRELDDAFSIFQAALNLSAHQVLDAVLPLPSSSPFPISLLRTQARSFDHSLAGIPLRILDTRTARTRYDADRPSFADRPPHQGDEPVDWLQKTLDWIAALRGPGILVVAQPVIESRAGWLARILGAMPDNNLPDYPDDWNRLVDALLASRHAVLVLTGDLHHSRLRAVESLNPFTHLSELRLCELMSSPLARIPQGWPHSPHSTGKFEPASGTRVWNILGSYFTEVHPTYATLTLSPFGAGLKVVAQAWTTDDNGAPTSQLRHEFKLF